MGSFCVTTQYELPLPAISTVLVGGGVDDDERSDVKGVHVKMWERQRDI